MSKRSFR